MKSEVRPRGARRRGPAGRRARRWILAAVAAVAAVQFTAACGGSDNETSDTRPGHTFVSHEQRVGPRLIDLTIQSRALGTAAMVRVMTPDGWSPGRGGRRWPVFYLLHGCCDTYDSWTRSTDIEELPQLRHVLVVMPEAGTVGFYSNWLGSVDGKAPAWETFHLTELPRILERDYGAGTPRVVAGQSMGGLGAMGYSERRPGFFQAAASFSGLLHPRADPDFLLGLFSHFTPHPRAIWGDPEKQRDVWAHHDPTELAARLRGMRLFVSSGDGTPGPFNNPDARRDPIEPTVLRESRAFVDRLRRLNIPAQVDFYGPGMHDWPYWEREMKRSLPMLLAGLRRGDR